MDYKIVEKPAFTAVGKSIRVEMDDMKDGANANPIPKFWGQCGADGTGAKLMGLSASATAFPHKWLGICADFTPDMKEFTYIIAADTTSAPPDGMIERPIPSATYAVFESRGKLPEAIQSVWQSVFSEFMPTSGYAHADSADLEVYPEGNVTADDYVCEVWIPVVKK